VGWLAHARTGRATAGAALRALAIGGCASEKTPVPAACTDSPATILAALERAPGAVALADGTRLSTCVSRARTDGDLQSLGLVLVHVADTLRARAPTDPDAALALGYLAGAVRAGAKNAASGIADQLARRVEQVAVLEARAGGASAAALRRGQRAGQSSG
jgi:hypothetical protein